jgi:outer membrane protein OmpA-like peptidoglycan-associated protein
MNKIFKLKIVLVCTFSLIGLLAIGQSKKTIILINSVPYYVVLSPEGEIEQVNSEAKGYMRGYKKSKEEFVFPEKEVASSEYLESLSVRRDRLLLAFETGYATMDEAATAQLDKVADNYVPGKSEKLLITAFKGSESDNNNLFDNRMSTVRTYLELKGVPSNAIITEVAVSPALKDQVSVTYIQE